MLRLQLTAGPHQLSVDVQALLQGIGQAVAELPQQDQHQADDGPGRRDQEGAKEPLRERGWDRADDTQGGDRHGRGGAGAEQPDQGTASQVGHPDGCRDERHQGEAGGNRRLDEGDPDRRHQDSCPYQGHGFGQAVLPEPVPGDHQGHPVGQDHRPGGTGLRIAEDHQRERLEQAEEIRDRDQDLQELPQAGDLLQRIDRRGRSGMARARTVACSNVTPPGGCGRLRYSLEETFHEPYEFVGVGVMGRVAGPGDHHDLPVREPRVECLRRRPE